MVSLAVQMEPGYVELKELPTTVLTNYFAGEDPARPSDATSQRFFFGAKLEEKEGLAISRILHRDCSVDMLLNLGKDLLLTRAMVKCGLMMGTDRGAEKRRKKGAYRGMNVITYKRIG